MKREKSDAVDFQTDPRANGSTPEPEQLSLLSSMETWDDDEQPNRTGVHTEAHNQGTERSKHLERGASSQRREKHPRMVQHRRVCSCEERTSLTAATGDSSTRLQRDALSCAHFYIHHKTLEQLSETHQSVKCLTGHVSPAHGVRLSIWACVQPDSALNHNLAVQSSHCAAFMLVLQ